MRQPLEKPGRQAPIFFVSCCYCQHCISEGRGLLEF